MTLSLVGKVALGKAFLSTLLVVGFGLLSGLCIVMVMILVINKKTLTFSIFWGGKKRLEKKTLAN